jgi:hypothetical protein
MAKRHMQQKRYDMGKDLTKQSLRNLKFKKIQ